MAGTRTSPRSRARPTLFGGNRDAPGRGEYWFSQKNGHCDSGPGHWQIEALHAFQRLAVERVRARVEEWREIRRTGVEQETELTRRQLASLARGDLGLMRNASRSDVP